MKRASYGTRRQRREQAQVLKSFGKEWLQERWGSRKEEIADVLLEDYLDRECIGHRTALSIVPEIMEWAGMNDKMVEKLIAALGAGSVDELARGFERGKMASEADVSSVDRRGIDYFRRRMQAEPGFRRQLLWELFGVREVESQAQEAAQIGRVATNGHMNGSGLKPHDESP